MRSGIGPPLEAMVVAAALAIAFVGCGGDDPGTGAASEPEKAGVITASIRW